MQKYKNRSEVPDKYKWDLTDFFQTEEEFNKCFESAKKHVEKLIDYKGCTKDSHLLYEFLKKEIEIMSDVENLYVYAHLMNDQELGIKENIERKNQTTDLINIFYQNVNFFESELLELDKTEYEKIFIKEPKLREFKSDLDCMYRNKEHVLSEKEENTIVALSNAMDHFEDLSSTLLNQEHDYGKIKLADGTIQKIATNNYRFLMRNQNRNIRKKVYTSFNKTLDQYGGTSAGLLNSYVKSNTTIAGLHHFKNAWECKLFNLNLSNQVFDVLVKTTEKNVTSFQKYIELRKKILGYDKLYYYDTKVELVKSDKEYSIEEAQELVKNAIKFLGENYLQKLNKIFQNRCIDYCEYHGKWAGGYSCATMTHDARILMSFNGNLESVSTIAHEAGHHVHQQYLNEFNPLQYRGQNTIVMEVVSLLNECLLSDYIMKNAKTKEEKMTGLFHMIDVMVSNLFGTIREGKIEQEMYQYVDNGGTITQEFMDNLVKKSYKKYFGKYVVIDKNIKNSWIIRSHYYNDFYLYSYAISICVATNLAQKILAGDKKTLDDFLNYLCVGGDKWTHEVFAVLGIDLEDASVYENAIHYFDSLVEQFENLYFDKEVGETNE